MEPQSASAGLEFEAIALVIACVILVAQSVVIALLWTHVPRTRRTLMEPAWERPGQNLAHLARVTMLGELSGGLAHELNQPLTSILSNAQAAQRLLAKDDIDMREVREILQDIVDADKRAGDVIRRLRALFKDGKTERQAFDIERLVRDALELTHSDLIARGVRVQLRSMHGLASIRGDFVQLEQVLLNLIMNACEAMVGNDPHDRQLEIDVTRIDVQSVQISVSDCGTGIPGDTLDRIFEPFFTTKAHGLGVGLALSKSIIEAHAGQIWAQNNVTRGATFKVRLPVQEDGQI